MIVELILPWFPPHSYTHIEMNISKFKPTADSSPQNGTGVMKPILPIQIGNNLGKEDHINISKVERHQYSPLIRIGEGYGVAGIYDGEVVRTDNRILSKEI